jgi:thioesterase domain-containing protein
VRHSTLDELAADYVQQIRAVQPRGPYLLYGASLGGSIAMEMARQLIAAGQDVPLVVLGDSSSPDGRLPPKFTQRLRIYAHNLSRMDRAARPRYLALLVTRLLEYHARAEFRERRQQNQRLERILTRGEPIPVSLRECNVMRQYVGLAHGHTPQPPYPQRTLLLRAGGPSDFPDRGWGALLGSALEIVDVPGTHTDLGRETSSGYVGPVINRVLERANSAG